MGNTEGAEQPEHHPKPGSGTHLSWAPPPPHPAPLALENKIQRWETPTKPHSWDSVGHPHDPGLSTGVSPQPGQHIPKNPRGKSHSSKGHPCFLAQLPPGVGSLGPPNLGVPPQPFPPCSTHQDPRSFPTHCCHSKQEKLLCLLSRLAGRGSWLSKTHGKKVIPEGVQPAVGHCEQNPGKKGKRGHFPGVTVPLPQCPSAVSPMPLPAFPWIYLCAPHPPGSSRGFSGGTRRPGHRAAPPHTQPGPLSPTGPPPGMPGAGLAGREGKTPGSASGLGAGVTPHPGWFKIQSDPTFSVILHPG